MNKTIKKALELCINTDFQNYLDKLNSRSPETLKYFFGDRVKDWPSINGIYRARDQQLKNNEALYQQHSGWPDAKKGKEDFLTIIAMNIIRQMEVLNRIRKGDDLILNMDLVGTIWANAETLKEHCLTVPAEVVNLYNELIMNRYISGSKDVFTHIMKYKRLPPRCNDKIKWLTYKSDAIYFKEKMQFTLKQLNDCFVGKNGKPFRTNNRQPTAPDPKPPLPDILKNFSTI